jgi:hypothetical protein
MKARQSANETDARKLLLKGLSGCNAGYEEVATRAYLLWEQEVRPDGCDVDHWLKTERRLEGTHDGVLNEPVHLSPPH